MCNLMNIHTYIQPYPVVYLVANPVCMWSAGQKNIKERHIYLQSSNESMNTTKKAKQKRQKERNIVEFLVLTANVPTLTKHFDYSGGLLAALRFYNTQTKSTCQKNIVERNLIVRLWCSSASREPSDHIPSPD